LKVAAAEADQSGQPVNQAGLLGSSKKQAVLQNSLNQVYQSHKKQTQLEKQ